MDPSEQILQLYETGATPEVIAKALQMPRGEIEALLFAGSGRFRMAQQALTRPSASDADRMLAIVMGLADHSDNEFIRLNAAKFARDDLKGRRDAGAPVINVVAIEEITKRLDAVESKRRQLFQRNAIDLPS